MATPAQIKKIHTLKSELRLDDSDYRVLLESYASLEGTPIWSSKDLSYDQASSLIRTMEHILNRTPSFKKKLNATLNQIRLVPRNKNIVP